MRWIVALSTACWLYANCKPQHGHGSLFVLAGGEFRLRLASSRPVGLGVKRPALRARGCCHHGFFVIPAKAGIQCFSGLVLLVPAPIFIPRARAVAPRPLGIKRRNVVVAMRTCDQTRQAIVKLNMAYVYRRMRPNFLENLGLHYLSEIIRNLRVTFFKPPSIDLLAQ